MSSAHRTGTNTLGGGNSRLQHAVDEVRQLGGAPQPDEAAKCTEKGIGQDAEDGSTSPCPEDEITVLTWEKDDPTNPYNFSKSRKRFIIFVSILTILNATLGSALPSNIVPKLAAEWGINSTYQQTLPITVFIMGKCA